MADHSAMNNRRYVTWTINSSRGQASSNAIDPDWGAIPEVFDLVLGEGGLLVVEAFDTHRTFEVRSDQGNFLVTIGEMVGEADNVRSFSDDTRPEGLVCVLGDWWDSRMICTDPELAKALLKEFFDTGNVVSPWMT